MDAIADRAFVEFQSNKISHDDTPSLLSVIIDIDPIGWYNIKQQIRLKDVMDGLLVSLNAHLSLNSSNQVAVLTSTPKGAQFLFPKPGGSSTKGRNGHKNGNEDFESRDVSMAPDQSRSNSPEEAKPSGTSNSEFRNLINPSMYRQFRLVDETVLEELDDILNDPETETAVPGRSSLPGALSTALTYSNRILNSEENVSMKSRILIISCTDDTSINYIPIMNCIFAAQKMKVPIDVCKLACDSSFLQQAADSTNGIYILLNHPTGLIQYLTTALFIEPSLRNLIVLPTNGNIDFRASCFITGKVVEVGYVCSVCLCILSLIPQSNRCPTCDSQFDLTVLNRLRRKPVVPGRKKGNKKRRLDGADSTVVSESASPA